MTTKEICDKSAFRKNGYLIEKQKSTWHLSIPLIIAEILRDIPRAYSPFLNELKRCYDTYYGYDQNENRLSSFLVRASYITAKATIEQKELADFSAVFSGLPHAKDEVLSTPQAVVLTFVVKPDMRERLKDSAKIAGEALASVPALNALAKFFHENKPPAGSFGFYSPPKSPPENLQNLLSAWIKEKFPEQAEKGFPLQTSLGVFNDAFNPEFSPNEFEKDLIAASFPFSAVLPGTHARPIDVATQEILRELARVEVAPKPKKRGSSKRITPEIFREMLSDRRAGISVSEIAEKYGFSREAVSKALNRKVGEILTKRAIRKKAQYFDGKSY